MAEYILPLEKLIEQFRKLPGIGKKTAIRLAFSVLEFSAEEAEAFAEAVRGAKANVRTCSVCQNFSDGELCPVCADLERNRSVICVVEDAKAVISLEKVKEFGGVYHVLHGAISPMEGIGPDKLRIRELMIRLTEEVK